MKTLPILLAGFCISFSSQIFAGGAATGGASEYTQIINMVQLADSYAQDGLRYQNEIMRYETMVKNLADNPLGVTGPNLQLLIDNQAKIMSYGSAIGQSMSQVDKNVAKAFNNPNASSFGVKFGVAANMALDQLKAAMLNMGLQHDNSKTDAENIKALVNKVQKADGDKGALQALGELNAASLQEAQTFRQTFAEQSQAVNMAMGAQVMKSRDEQKQSEDVQSGFADAPIGSGAKLNPTKTTYKTLDLYKTK